MLPLFVLFPLLLYLPHTYIHSLFSRPSAHSTFYCSLFLWAAIAIAKCVEIFTFSFVDGEPFRNRFLLSSSSSLRQTVEVRNYSFRQIKPKLCHNDHLLELLCTHTAYNKSQTTICFKITQIERVEML